MKSLIEAKKIDSKIQKDIEDSVGSRLGRLSGDLVDIFRIANDDGVEVKDIREYLKSIVDNIWKGKK